MTDVLIIGSGIGGASLAAGLAASGLAITMLERGEPLADSPAARDARAIFQRGYYRPEETWLDGQGIAFNPGNYYYLGGNSKFYGAVMLRYRVDDFQDLEHLDGVSPAWPFAYAELEPWYGRAEQLFKVRGQALEDPTEPPRSTPYSYPPIPDEPAIAAVRQRLAGAGVKPFSLPLAVDLDQWLARAPTPWDAFPDTRSGKLDAETAALASARANPGLKLLTGAEVKRLIPEPSGRRIRGVEYQKNGESHFCPAKIIVLAAGAVNSAVLLLRSQEGGLANRSGMVGRHFMNHNCSALLAIDPRFANDSIYQKTLGLNDFYLPGPAGQAPLGNAQLLGRVTAPILKANLKAAPEWSLRWLARHSVDWYAMSEDLPDPNSRVTLDGSRIRLDWRRSNWRAHEALVRRLKLLMQAAGFPIVLTRPFDRRTPSHQCGTVRIGLDPAKAPLDPWCRAYDHPNLFVVDAAFLPSSAAVNPALTIAAQALRVADHMLKADFFTRGAG